MGGNSASHFPEEEGVGGVTFVKGIRLSDRVINRMRQSSNLGCPRLPAEPQKPAAPPPTTALPLQEPVTTPLEGPSPPVKLIPPPPVKFHSLPPSSTEQQTLCPSEAVVPTLPPPSPPVELQSPTPPAVEPTVLPPTESSEPTGSKDRTTPLIAQLSIVESSPLSEPQSEPSSPPCELQTPKSVSTSPSLEPLEPITALPPPMEPANTTNEPPLLEAIPPPSPPVELQTLPPLIEKEPPASAVEDLPALKSLTVESTPPCEVSEPPPAAPIVLESFTAPDVEPTAQQSIDPELLPPSVQSSAPAEPPSPPCELQTQPLVSDAPCFEPREPITDLPLVAVIAPSNVEATSVVPPAAFEDMPVFQSPPVDTTPPSEELPPQPPPEPITEPPPAPKLPFEEMTPPCECVEPAVGPTETAVAANPLECPPDAAAAAEEPTKPQSAPVAEDEAVMVETEPPGVPPPSPEAVEEELRQKIKQEMQRNLEDEINQRRLELQQQLEEMRVDAHAKAQAAAQALVEDQVTKTLQAEKSANTQKLSEAITKERMKTDDQKLMVQLYRMELKAHQLEEKEKELKKRNTLHKEHIAKLEAKCTEFYRVSAESFQKGKEETHSRFARFNIQPICGELQSQILKCYQDKTGKTLSCSGIASAYMQCVDNAKKNKLSTGG